MDFAVTVKEIYEHLEDDLSREIFENRLLHSSVSFPANWSKFLRNITLACPQLTDPVNKLIADSGHNIILYGAGYYAGQLASYLGSAFRDQLNITAICDSDEKKWGTDIYGYKVISPEELREKYSDATVIISTGYETTRKVIHHYLVNLGFPENRIWIFHENEDQYFDQEVLPANFGEDEVFIDAGCFDFKSSMQFIKWCGNKYKKIIAFEPDPEQYPVCLEHSKGIHNATIHPFGLWNENMELRFDNDGVLGSARIIDGDSEKKLTIKTVKLDDILGGEKATFIKMDIEGAELNALRGAEQTIRKYRPKLAISVYHKPEDICEIPAYILSLHNDYKFYLRHYSFGNDDTVLYAI